MKRASYQAAIEWMARNDDTEWLSDEQPILSVTACLIADLFEVSEDKVTADLKRVVGRVRKQDRAVDAAKRLQS